MEHPFAYLNTNSTYATKTGYYNPSDLGYDDMVILRKEKMKTFEMIKKLVNAKETATVILNSGATESIATCINWAKHYNAYGSIYGTEFDHSSVKKNVINQDMEYKLIDEGIENAAGIFLTHVNSRTGEILDDNYLHISDKLFSLQEATSDFEADVATVPYQPLIFLDVSQSIMKTKVDMQDAHANALFFSLHKIGGPTDMGVLVIDAPASKSFIPLIAGEQNNGMRGGTMNEMLFVQNRDIFTTLSLPENRIRKWNSMKKILIEHNVKIIEPKGKHIYNTFLIDTETKDCPLALVHELAKHNIYVGTVSACEGEAIYNGKISGGSDNNTYIRLSFDDPSDINNSVMTTLCSVISTFKNE